MEHVYLKIKDNSTFMVKRSLFLVIFLSFATGILAQKKYQDITAEEYLEDFDILVNIIKKQHPNPFRFVTEKEFDKQIGEIRKDLAKDPNYGNFLLANPFPIIHDAHSGLATDLIVFEDFANSSRFFPLSTFVYEDKVFVNQFNNDIPAGAILLEVNGEAVGKILERIRITRDGNIEANSAKDFTLYSSLMAPNQEQYEIVYQDSLNAIDKKTVVIPSVNYAKSYYNAQKAILPTDLISYSYGIYTQPLNEDTYLLTIKTFSFSEEYAYHKLSSFFDLLKEKGVKNLVIDIRGNSGGLLSNIPLYYSFIAKDRFFKNNYQYATKVVDINVRENLVDGNGRLMSDMDVKNLDNFMYQRFDPSEEGAYYYGNNRLDETYIENYPKDKRAFDGDVILLIDNNTVSAATYFATLFKENERGVIVGRETRTCSNFTTASWFINYRLPNTQTIVNLPRSEVFFNTEALSNEHCRGVIPDYVVDEYRFRKGIVEVEDPDINLVMELLKVKKEQENKDETTE